MDTSKLYPDKDHSISCCLRINGHCKDGTSSNFKISVFNSSISDEDAYIAKPSKIPTTAV